MLERPQAKTATAGAFAAADPPRRRHPGRAAANSADEDVGHHHPTAENILVRIEAADGSVGWGEAASAPTMTGDTLGGLSPRCATTWRRCWSDRTRATARLMRELKRALMGNTGAHSAVEMALLDLAGRASNQPLIDMLGRAARTTVQPMWLLGNKSPSRPSPKRRPRSRGHPFLQAQDRRQAARPTRSPPRSRCARRSAEDAAVRRRQWRADARGAKRYVERTRAAKLAVRRAAAAA